MIKLISKGEKMTKEKLIDLAEYYRQRHNEICQDDFVIEKPDYSLFLSSFNKGEI
tara:strand:+ start:606 stop:770 length:165 start_codon:yes stop_codon:yes gene_type:complete